MNLEELIASTNRVNHRDMSSVFRKKFGSIMAFNKKASVGGLGNVIVVSMMIGGVTDFIKSGGKRTPVPYHKVALAINVGEDGYKEYTAAALVEEIRKRTKEFDGLPDPAVLEGALKDPTKFFEGWTLFQKSNNKGFVIVRNQIPKESQVQVWCSCSDYYWTFEYYNIQNKNSKGASLNYYSQASSAYPKTYRHQSAAGKKSKRPMRNPGRHPGMCKHLMLLVAMLMKESVLKDSNGLSKFYEANFEEFIEGKMKKERLDQDKFARVMEEYKKGQRDLSAQRRRYNYMTGSKAPRKDSTYNRKTGRYTWEDK